MNVEVKVARFQVLHLVRRQRDLKIAKLAVGQRKQYWSVHARPGRTMNVGCGLRARQAAEIQGNARALVSLARQEKDPELKKSIINQLSLMNSKEAVDYLMEYLKD